MTTICYDGNLLCSDSKAIAGHILQKDVKKIYTFSDEKYIAIAFCGFPGDFQGIIDWLLGGDKHKIENDSACICIDKNKIAWRFTANEFGLIEAGLPDSNGSGSSFAIGAMLAGSTAFGAVEISSRLDTDTGGPVQCYNIKTGELTGPFRE